MTLDEIEKEIQFICSHKPDCYDAEFAQKYIHKLLAVVKAAECAEYNMRHNTNSLTGEHINPCECCDYFRAKVELQND